MLKVSPLQATRLSYKPELPKALLDCTKVDFQKKQPVRYAEELLPLFPHLSKGTFYTVVSGEQISCALKIGVVLSGGQAAGGHNVIAGLFDGIKKIHPKASLIGFLNGPAGIVKNEFKEITGEYLDQFRNQGGFDIIGSGRTKIETDEQFKKVLQTVRAHDLDGLVVIGGDDSNTNAAFLAEYFLQHGQKTAVIGVPKTIDGDLKSASIELSFGFDTACKTYSEAIGNIARDAISAKKYYFFVKLMGRSASHITLECALQTQPNMALIAEEAAAEGTTLQDITTQIVTLVKERKKAGKEYGLILIPEGIIEFLPDMKALIQALNTLLAPTLEYAAQLDKLTDAKEKVAFVLTLLNQQNQETMKLLPEQIQLQLLLDRDPHGNVQVSRIETERLFIHLVEKALDGLSFSAVSLFFGYEGRAAMPSNFDANYCYALGILAASALARKLNGCIVSFEKLHLPVSQWVPALSPLLSLLHMEVREGKKRAVIEKALVDLKGAAFTHFAKNRAAWRLDDCYCQVGPIQYFGPKELTDTTVFSLGIKNVTTY